MDTFISNNPEETFGLGQRWAAELRPGWIVGLIGDLGTGKTQLVKGIAAGLGIPGTVTSPTFALLQEHDDGTLPLAASLGDRPLPAARALFVERFGRRVDSA